MIRTIKQWLFRRRIARLHKQADELRLSIKRARERHAARSHLQRDLERNTTERLKLGA